jgi:peptidoglycan/xylan/chitin deacetylase (PgdA/CDA1 family)
MKAFPALTMRSLTGCACGFIFAATVSAETLPLQNPGFEDGIAGWTLTPGAADAVNALPEAASLGKRGLRVRVVAGAPRFALTSGALAVTPGRTYTAEFWGGGGGAGSNNGKILVEAVFADAAGKELKPDRASIRVWPAKDVSAGRYFSKYTIGAAAPAGATSLSLRIKPYGAGGASVDLDDFVVEALPVDDPAKAAAPADPSAGHPVPVTDPVRLAAWLEEIKNDPFRGAQPPKIVIKLDDLKPSRGGVHARWVRAADFAAERKIKVGLGIIAEGMKDECAPFCDWVKARRAAGGVEFWFHGYDHSRDGKNMEFSGQPYAFQKQHVEDSQRLAREKLGFAFTSFGAPFNATDETTRRVFAEDPDLQVWMYGDRGDAGDKVVLERAFAVNLESPTIIANHGAFIEGYAHNRGAAYFVLQGHPAGWGDDRFEQFVKIIDFLISQKAEFVFASDFATRPDLRRLATP